MQLIEKKLALVVYVFLAAIIISCEPEKIGSEKIDLDISSCITPLSSSELNIVTWNIEKFPLTPNTPEYLDDIIDQLDADIIAVQEINSPFALSTVIEKLPEWNGKIHSEGDLMLGFLYKNTEVTITDLDVYFEDDKNGFPRPMIGTVVTHILSGEVIHLYNLHLKCCGDASSVQRRKNATSRIKSHVDGSNKEDNTIILGDFNDMISNENKELNTFSIFLLDPDNWLFADMEIAESTPENWSYPSFPSHLDHILISNELFDNINETKTVKIESCVPDYMDVVSDHRPVMATFSFK